MQPTLNLIGSALGYAIGCTQALVSHLFGARVGNWLGWRFFRAMGLPLATVDDFVNFIRTVHK